MTSFVGRRGELAEVARLLGRSRLVTLTGMGGVGKTRLAVRAARRLESRFPDGVWFVELSALREPRLLGHALCSVLMVDGQNGRARLAVLEEFLAERRALVVLDTFEHLADGCAPMLESLLRAAPGLRVLVTSRRALGVPGEACLQVEPLPVEGTAAGPDGRAPEGAVALFAERAASSAPGFALSPEVAVLCRLLDGIPLAIELAAVRLRAMSVEQMISRMDRRFDLLSDGGRSPVPRHRTLRTAIGWSHELCRPLERLLWARLSAFPDDFDLEAVQAVCADQDTGTGLHRELVEDVLIALVEQSIVLRVDTGRAIRFRMLDTLREYGAEWLRELGQDAALRRRHRDHYLGLAARFDAEWFGPDQVAWRARMSAESPNLRSALEFCLGDPDEHPAGLELAGRLAYFWIACGFVAEGRHYLRRVLALRHPPGPGLTRALWTCAYLADFQGDLDEANDLATECLSQAFSQRDGEGVGWGTVCCANTGMHWGQFAEALAMYERARETHEDGGDRKAGVAYALACQAYALARLGRYEEALACLRRQRALCESWGEIWLRSAGDWVRSLIELARGDLLRADRYARTSLCAKHLLHDSLGMGMALAALARTAAGLGRMERAARLLGVGALVERSFGLRLGRPEPDGLREQAEGLARAALGEAAFESAFAAGRALDIDAAMAFALASEEAAAGSRTEA
ncbi:ATP-binding protein [Sphaerisporangium fuscum]|uniref:ATP-binding protein n=1 Tax=Sphaerisporangium fuscum TaxID=2835868 RepID=UPI001BDD3D69|nr:AAA family ATPase [Sphaerisporangium fuscum]